MIKLDDRLATLRRHAHEWGRELRPYAMDLDADPAVPRALDSMAVRYLQRVLVPEDPLVVDGHRFDGVAALERVVVFEELCRGDAGVTLAAPGPSLSGVLIARLGDPAQREYFFSRVRQERLWTFFALTEPSGGSDAGGLSTDLSTVDETGNHRLNGVKRFVGSARRARLGTVFARTRPGPLGVIAVLVDAADPGFQAVPLPMIGLRGLEICAIDLTDVAVAPQHVLGRHLPPSARGLWSAVQTFNQLRPGVAAIALGIARAAVEYIRAERPGAHGTDLDRIERLESEVASVRQLIWAAAVAVDRNPRDGYLASAAKARAVRLAEEATLGALALLGPGARLDHPYLDKLARDARGVEFMEGTRHIQRLNASQGVINGRFAGRGTDRAGAPQPVAAGVADGPRRTGRRVPADGDADPDGTDGR
ncbi:acyl-CoA dehydrogenase family protein [Actinoplanes sp. TBRC 11911]|uniref:acyl-CoA dehydrogenase family protein n=1 Tax=Actinoplanes sp. TBRC 11911 TaxID=2729386 RepID=UPI0020070CC3|nr:acyl-CoA dehydrogenase family protein [Actinoplanes sp. TBRC 11911]